jgi:hypothetical protein
MRLVDAQRMHEQHPDTFEVPDPSELDAIGPGDCVKVCFEDINERIWIRVTGNDAGTITGTLDNDPVGEGIAYGDTVTLEPRNVLDILRERSGHDR